MEFSKGVLGLLVLVFSVGFSAHASNDFRTSSSFSINSVTVSSSWTCHTPFSAEAFEDVLMKALSGNSAFRRASIGGRKAIGTASNPRAVTPPSEYFTYVFLKSSYVNIPEVLVTLRRSGSSTDAANGSLNYTLTDPVNFYFTHWDVKRKPFSVNDVSLTLSFSQSTSTVNLSSTFSVSNLLFLSWVNTFISPIQMNANVTLHQILLSLRMAFHATHEYLSKNY